MGKKHVFGTLADVEPEEIDWLFPGLIPYKKITFVEGDPDVGKSFFAMHLAAVITVGGKLPDGTRVQKGNVLYISAEDDAADTIRPRIETMGGDLSRIRFMQDLTIFDEEGLAELRDEMREHWPDLVVIDTMYSFIPDWVDLSKPTSIRKYIHALDKTLKEFEPAVLIIRHWTKGSKGKAIYRGVGAIDFSGLVRSSIAVAKDPENENLRILAQVKHSNSRGAVSRVFELVSDDGKIPVLMWRGTSTYTADALESGSGNKERELDRAADFLRSALRKPQPVKKIEAEAKRRGIHKRTLDRARAEIGIITNNPGKGGWIVSLPSSKRIARHQPELSRRH